LKEHWAADGQKAQIRLQQTREHLSQFSREMKNLDPHISEAKFQNTVAQVYSRLFADTESVCPVKSFGSCPYMDHRENLLRRGLLANAFVTILQKATFYAMRERHREDSGLLDDEYDNVFGIDLTDFQDLKQALSDGRFESLFQVVANRAAELAGLHASNASSSYSNRFPSYHR
jgi:hypothetical protein